jgi:hypothetical protein
MLYFLKNIMFFLKYLFGLQCVRPIRKHVLGSRFGAISRGSCTNQRISRFSQHCYFVFMLATTIHGGRPRQLPTRAAQSGDRPEETSTRRCLPPCPHPQICKPHTNRPLAGTAPILRFFCCRLQLGSCSSSPQTHATSDS